jgi:diguanylate cyclase (GGDEF)-like protein
LYQLTPERTPGGPERDASNDATRTLVRTFQRVTTSMYTSSDLNHTLQLIADGVIQLVGFRSAVVCIALPDGGFEYVAFNGPPEVRDALRGVRMSSEQWDWRIANSVRWGSLCYIDHSVPWPDTMTAWIPDDEMVGAPAGDPDAWDPNNYLFAPMLGPRGEVLGVLSVDLPVDGRKPDAAQLELLELFAESAAMAVRHSMLLDELHRQHKISHHMATHDTLTGLANRIALNDAATDIRTSTARSVTALVIDLDHFKDVNDEFGHAAGDEVLVAVARRMGRVIRVEDVLARTGGDEFVVLVSGADADQRAAALVERLRTVITSPIRGTRGTYGVGVSIGVATKPTPTTLSELLQAADADMYRMKRAQRGDTDHLRLAR